MIISDLRALKAKFFRCAQTREKIDPTETKSTKLQISFSI